MWCGHQDVFSKMHSISWFQSSILFGVSCVISFPMNRSSYQGQGGYENKPPVQPFDGIFKELFFIF